MIQRPRIFYISAVIPDTTSGGRFAMYRHFIERQDFAIELASVNQPSGIKLEVVPVPMTYPIARLCRTRFSRVGHNLGYIWNWTRLSSTLLRKARSFRPDIVFTVPDNWHCGLAWKIARELHIPLVVNFQDLFPLSRFLPNSERPFPPIRNWLLERFRFLHKQASLVFYTSEGMREWFGGHQNGHVLYPIGAAHERLGVARQALGLRPLRIAYTGNCYGAYGRMLLGLAQQTRRTSDIQLQIFAAGNDWPAEVVAEMKACGIYMGFRPFDQLKPFLEAADAFLTVMSFEKEEETFVRTSFTTKWLDYAPYAKPVCAWGPDCSSAIQFARQYDCGMTITDPDPLHAIRALRRLAQDPELWMHCSTASKRIASTLLEANSLHDLLRTQINDLTSGRQKNRNGAKAP